MTRVLACGGLTIDWLQTTGGRSGPSLGGNAAYAAVGAWLAGALPSVIAVVGEDYPGSLLAELQSGGIDMSGVRHAAGPSFRVLLDESRAPRRISYLEGSGHNDTLDPLPTQLPILDHVDGVHVCAIPTASQAALLSAVEGRVAVVTLDTVVIPGEIEPATEPLLELARRSTVFMPSRDEVRYHWPGSVAGALATIAAQRVPRVVVKLGSEGSIGRDGVAEVRVPAADAEVRDPTGAGDAYCGAVCARLAAGDQLSAAMRWGAAVASVVIEGHGATFALNAGARTLVATRAASLERDVFISVPA